MDFLFKAVSMSSCKRLLRMLGQDGGDLNLLPASGVMNPGVEGQAAPGRGGHTFPVGVDGTLSSSTLNFLWLHGSGERGKKSSVGFTLDIMRTGLPATATR